MNTRRFLVTICAAIILTAISGSVCRADAPERTSPCPTTSDRNLRWMPYQGVDTFACLVRPYDTPYPLVLVVFEWRLRDYPLNPAWPTVQSTVDDAPVRWDQPRAVNGEKITSGRLYVGADQPNGPFQVRIDIRFLKATDLERAKRFVRSLVF